MKIIADRQIPFIQEYFQQVGELILFDGRNLRPQQLKNADILLVRSVTKVDENLLKNSAIKFVGSVTAGFDHLDINYLNQQGIAFAIAKGFNAPPVSDYVVSVIAAIQKTLPLTFQHKNAAVIGVGAVGSLVVSCLKTLGFSVLTSDPIRKENDAHFNHTPLSDIADVDIICLHVPLTQKDPYPTYHFIDASFLKKQKKGCVLLNASRGAIIHTDDLLKRGQHLLWCLDVFDPEPNINQQLLQHAFIATPHIAGYSIQSKLRGIHDIYKSAIEKKIIPPGAFSVNLPRNSLIFTGKKTWQDIVLGIFNPILMTNMMHTLLTPVSDTSFLFDKLRHDFNYRHEFHFTTVKADLSSQEDELILKQLGIAVC